MKKQKTTRKLDKELDELEINEELLKNSKLITPRKEQTPQVISVLYRKLKPGKTFADFQKAHLPPGECHKTEFGYEVDYFNVRTRVINAVSATDPI